MRPAPLRLVVLASCALTPALFAGLADDAAPRDTVLRVHGSDSIGASLMGELLSAFLKAEGWGGVERAPSSGGTSYNIVGLPTPTGKPAGAFVEISDPDSALAALDQGFADIAMSSRRIRPGEARQFARLGNLTVPPCEQVLALDAVAVIANVANPTESLTRQQLKDIYLRRATSWQEVGGSGPIHLYARESKSGTHATFQTAILDEEDLPPDLPRQPDNRSLAEAVANDSRGIGLVALAFAGRNKVIAISDAKPLPRVTRPSAATIRNGEYPMSRRLYLYTAAAPENPLVRRFLAFALGPSGQAIVTKAGFVSSAPETTPVPEPLAAPAPVPVASPTPPPAEVKPAPSPAQVIEPTERPRRIRPRPTPAPPKPRATPQAAPRATPRATAPAVPGPAATPENNPSSSGGG
ncbi:hypothetical protein AYO41_00135 [Verrucomicrobia bacterium SCGC AG-212-E04]|nr:hypothetical protein AYO41_00135 [Verrucomicrobia bacterium SCGC AG-212-E04]